VSAKTRVKVADLDTMIEPLVRELALSLLEGTSVRICVEG
jgi:hypothetical protein